MAAPMPLLAPVTMNTLEVIFERYVVYDVDKVEDEDEERYLGSFSLTDASHHIRVGVWRGQFLELRSILSTLYPRSLTSSVPLLVITPAISVDYSHYLYNTSHLIYNIPFCTRWLQQ